jgi:glucose dehydrogenase
MPFTRSVYRILPGLLLTLLLTGGLPLRAQETTPQAGSFDVPPEIAGHEQEWPLGNHDYANARAAVGSSINQSNVSQLNIAWTFELKGKAEWGGAAGNPVIANNVVYVQDLGANTYALNFQTGDLIWQHLYNHQIFGPSGPGIGYGKVYVCSRIDQYAALDINTGEELWTYYTGTAQPTGAFQPTAFGNQLYITTQTAPSGHGKITFDSYKPGSSGFVIVVNPDNGSLLWQWQAVEDGFWGHPELNSGAGLWFPPAIDTHTGVSFWGTGNPSPVSGIKGYPNGSSRPGPNLYTNSLVALDHQSGQMLWYKQVKPHDLFNLDFQVSPILASVKIDDGNRDLVIGSGKLGVVYGFDRQTGEILWQTSVGQHQNDELSELPPGETVWVAPGAWGGVETPMAYADGTLYVLTANLPSPYNATSFDAETPMEALNRSEGGTILANGTAELLAINASSGEILWDTKIDEVAFGGVTVVNDLVFTATLRGMIMAFSRNDGKLVWQYQAPGGTNAWPAVTGDTIVWPIGLGDKPQVIALRLGGQGAAPTPEQQRTPVMTPQHG